MSQALAAGLRVRVQRAGLIGPPDAVADVDVLRVGGAELAPGGDLLVTEVDQVALVVVQPQSAGQVGPV
ncbi:hypothetical protein ACFYRY_05210 [Streptomyces sp. NPDC005263]|uniref:hypothetical protein n=1 Tax=Streptomyces sp. NPDC005263 TaxID=3364711 RepID=UPI00369363D5